jgi:acyl carrier protein
MTTCLALGFWSEVAIVLAVGTCLCWVWILLDKPRRGRLRREHLGSHQEISAGDFLQEARIPPDKGLAGLAVREAVAKTMGVPSSTVHPADSLEYVGHFEFDGMDFIELVMMIEDEIGVSIPDSFWEPLLATGSNADKWTVGQIACFVAENRESLRPGGRRHARKRRPGNI